MGINFAILIALVLILTGFNVLEYELIYWVPVIGLLSFNVLKSVFYFYLGDLSKARTYLLSSLLVLIIGGSSCVAIKFKPKKQESIPQEKKQEKTVKPNAV